MPAFADVEQITIRVGPAAFKHGDEWERCCQGKVEHDRWIYLYAISGEYGPCEMKEIIRETVRLGRIFGWKGIRWTRKRNGETHIASFPIRQPDLCDPHPID